MRFVLCICVLLLGCNVAPEEINYGSDACHYCKMNIVDDRFASELVTTKGKVYKFDAVECMINFTRDGGTDEIALTLVTTYDRHGELYDATQAVYVRSPKMPSPMGMYITPFRSDEKADEARNANGGNILSWDELTDNFESLPNLAE